MAEEKLLSVVITTYRREEEIINRAVQSVLEQTYQNLELILVDDNRGDNPFSGQIKKIADSDSRITYARTQGSYGAQAARNKGISLARGAYIAFLDDDDDWLPQKAEKQIALLEKEQDAGMCYCRGYRVNENFNPPIIDEFQRGNFQREVTYKELLRGDCIGTTSQALIRREVFDKCGNFDESFPARQDYEMWVRISRDFRLVGVDECLFRYHRYPGEQTTKKWKNCIIGHTRLYEKYKEDIDKDKKAKFNVVFYLAHYYRVGHVWGKGIGLYIKAFFISPSSFWKKGCIKLRDTFRYGK